MSDFGDFVREELEKHIAHTTLFDCTILDCDIEKNHPSQIRGILSAAQPSHWLKKRYVNNLTLGTAVRTPWNDQQLAHNGPITEPCCHWCEKDLQCTDAPKEVPVQERTIKNLNNRDRRIT